MGDGAAHAGDLEILRLRVAPFLCGDIFHAGPLTQSFAKRRDGLRLASVDGDDLAVAEIEDFVALLPQIPSRLGGRSEFR